VMEYGGHASSITNPIAFNELLRGYLRQVA